MPTSVLVPLDGSALAETVLSHAVILAHATGSDLTLLRVTPPPPIAPPLAGALLPPPLLYETGSRELEAARAYLAAVADDLAQEKLGVRGDVVEGDPATEIVDYTARHPEVRYLAMATHGQSGLRRWVFGSVAAKVLHAASVPLLLVRPRGGAAGLRVPPARAYRTILVPLDGSPLAESALDVARPLAAATGADLNLLSVVPQPEDEGLLTWADDPAFSAAVQQTETSRLTRYLEQVREQMRGSGPAVRSHLTHGHPAEAILEIGDQLEADLIVMATHGRGGWRRFWLGSVALKVVEGAYRPVLLVRGGAADPLHP
jgi:nucleotide-binding universal stress UspA family protein